MSYYKPPECDGVPTPSRHVIEPDWIASECDDQLPAFSKIGRGPRGKGVYTEIEKTDDGQVIIHFKDDETGEEIGSTGDIAAGRISVSYAPENPVAGDEVKMFVSVRSGSSVANYVVPVPSGAYGSRIYLLPGPVVRNSDDTYQCSVNDLTIYGLQRWESKPEPRPNDVILFNYEDSDSQGFAFGTVEAVEKGQVVYTARVFNALPGVSILPDGTWAVDGESTGIKAQGPKGEDAKIKVRREGGKAVITATDSDGETEAEVLDGKDGQDAKLTVQRAEDGAVLTATDSDGVTTAAVKDGSDGEDGSDGLPAILTLGSVQETSQPQVTLVPGRVQENEYIISFGLPRGSDGKSIDINGGVYRVDQLPDFDETPVNDAFVVLDGDDRFDLYIRGKEAVIAEEGGPWTVVEDWQGVNGYSMRMLAGRKISTEEVLRIPVDEVEIAFVPHNGLRDGDLVFDDNGTIGIVGSAMDDSGDYTVSYIDKMNVHWDNIDGKPVLASTDSIELTESDGIVTADLRVKASGPWLNGKGGQGEGVKLILFDHKVDPDGLSGHCLAVDDSYFDYDTATGLVPSDSMKASLSKADSAIQEDDLTAAIAAEASAREKADQLLETEIDGKLDVADLVAGKNISITHDPESGKVTIDNTMKLIDSASGPVAHIDDNAFAQKPLGLKVYGNTRQNLWKNPSGTSNGVTVTSNEDGSITVSGKATSYSQVYSAYSYSLEAGKSYTLEVDSICGGYGFSAFFYSSDGGQISGYSVGTRTGVLKETFSVPSNASSCRFGYGCQNTPDSAQPIEGTYRVMLREATEEEIAAAQQTASMLAESEPFDWCPPGLNSVESLEIVTAGKNLWASKAFTDGGITAVVNDDGSVTLDGTSTSSAFDGKRTVTGFLPPGEYTLSVDRTADENATFFVRAVVYGAEMTLIAVSYSSKTFTIPVGSSNVICGVQVVQGDEVHGTFRVQLERGATATDWVPPVAVTSTPIDLDGNQLCSLPDGTRDELHIDESGAVTLVKRTGIDVAPTDASRWYLQQDNARAYFSLSNSVPDIGDNQTFRLMCDKLPVRAAVNDPSYAVVGNGDKGYAKNPAITDTATVVTIAGGATYLYPLAEEQEITLDAVTLPALPAPNANVWASAEVPVEVELEYLTEDAEVLTRFLMPGNIKAGSNVSIDVDGNDVTVSSSGGGVGTGSIDTATDEEFQEYMGY